MWDGANRVVGYVEAKLPSQHNLDAIEAGEQLTRYRRTFPNLILTNFCEFRLYRDGHRVDRVVAAQTLAADVLAMNPDGVFLSNGPGDPEPCDYAIAAIREFLDRGIPTFGICLGHQLLALASGAKTLKMKFGHHGANHPVKDMDTGQVLITSQNHGFAVDGDSLPKNLRATHVSLFDGSLQGIARTDVPAFSFQGHPEASPGPHDVAYLFDRFLDAMTRGVAALQPAK